MRNRQNNSFPHHSHSCKDGPLTVDYVWCAEKAVQVKLKCYVLSRRHRIADAAIFVFVSRKGGNLLDKLSNIELPHFNC